MTHNINQFVDRFIKHFKGRMNHITSNFNHWNENNVFKKKEKRKEKIITSKIIREQYYIEMNIEYISHL